MSHLTKHLHWIAPSLAIALVVASTVAQESRHPAFTLADFDVTTQTEQASADLYGPAPLASVYTPANADTSFLAAEQDVTRAAPFDLLQIAAPPADTAEPEPSRTVETAFLDAPCDDALSALADAARVYFPMGGVRAEAAGLSAARDIARAASACPDVVVQVEGHAAPSSHARVNQRLSERRAKVVIEELAASGINTSHLLAVGFGDTRPAQMSGPKSKAYYNRRVAFSVISRAQAAARREEVSEVSQTGRFEAIPASEPFHLDAGVPEVVPSARDSQTAAKSCATPQGQTVADTGQADECALTNMPFLSVNVIGQPDTPE